MNNDKPYMPDCPNCANLKYCADLMNAFDSKLCDTPYGDQFVPKDGAESTIVKDDTCTCTQ